MRTSRTAAAILCAAALAACGLEPPVEPEPTLHVAQEPAPPARALGRLQAPAPPAPHADARRSEPLVVLVPSDDPSITWALVAGLNAAFDDARLGIGPDLRLYVAPMPERWGSAAEIAVTDALDAGALAIVAPPERRNAHLLAQFATKAKVPMLSTSAAHSVGASGSTWVVEAVPTSDRIGDGPPPVPRWGGTDADLRAVTEALRARLGRDPGPWERVGYSVGRTALTAARISGLRREGFTAAARDAVAATSHAASAAAPAPMREPSEAGIR